jgi:hypothetical protein
MPAPLIHRLMLFSRKHPHKRVHPARQAGLSNGHAQATCSHENVKYLLFQELRYSLRIWTRRFRIGTRERSSHHDRYLCSAWLAERIR